MAIDLSGANSAGLVFVVPPALCCTVEVESPTICTSMLERRRGNSESSQPWLPFVRNNLFGAPLAVLLEQMYTRYGHSLSSRSAFARHCLTLAVTRAEPTGTR